MDWDRAIERQQEALRRLMLMVFALLGPWATGRMPRGTHRALLRLLRPAESAVRRLVVIVAHRMKGPIALPQPGTLPDFSGMATRTTRPVGFALIDPRKRFAELAPAAARKAKARFSMPGQDDPVFAASLPDDGRVDGTRVRARLDALRLVLDTLPRQARRLMRLQARPATAGKPRLSPLRPGLPPGYRRKSVHRADRVLADCHALAFHALHGSPDTS